MGVFENLPYTNFHELNLEWIVKKLKELEAAVYGVDAVAPEAITVTNGPSSQWLQTGGWFYKYGRLVTAHLRIQITDATGLTTKILLNNLPLPNDERNVQLIAWAHHNSYSMIIPVVLRLTANGTLEYDGETTVSSTTYAIADNDIIVLDLTYIAKEE